MEFNLDKVFENLREKGEALSSFGKKNDDLIKVKDKEVVELSKDKKEDIATEAILEKSGDGSVAEEVYQKDEGVITTKDKKKESENDLEKIKQRITQFSDIIKRKRKESLKNYALVKDNELGDYKVVSQKAVNNNYRGKYPPDDLIGNMEQHYREYIIGQQPQDISIFTNAKNQVKQASDKKEQENQKNI